MARAKPVLAKVMRQTASHRAFITFCLIGFLNTALYSGLMIGFVEGAHVRPTYAACISFLLANLFSYAMNSWFSFKQRPDRAGYVRFFAVSLFNLLVTVGITYLCERYGVHYLIGLIGVILTSTVLTFLLHQRFSFKG